MEKDLFKFNNRNTRKRCEICLKLTIKTPERRRSGVFYCYFEHISYLFLVFEEVNVSWDVGYKCIFKETLKMLEQCPKIAQNEQQKNINSLLLMTYLEQI